MQNGDTLVYKSRDGFIGMGQKRVIEKKRGRSSKINLDIKKRKCIFADPKKRVMEGEDGKRGSSLKIL